jgi:hypothetical protein
MTETPQTKASWFLEEFKKQAVRLAVLAFIAAGVWVWSPISAKISAVWNTPDRLGQIEDTLLAIVGRLDRISGSQRVIVQPEGMSFVRVPVTLGEPIVLVLYVGRTEVGSACILREIIPAFTDENDVQRAGVPTRPMRQLGPTIERTEIELQQPTGLAPGRTRVSLQLEYLCGTVTKFETTTPVFYYALPLK